MPISVEVYIQQRAHTVCMSTWHRTYADDKEEITDWAIIGYIICCCKKTKKVIRNSTSALFLCICSLCYIVCCFIYLALENRLLICRQRCTSLEHAYHVPCPVL